MLAFVWKLGVTQIIPLLMNEQLWSWIYKRAILSECYGTINTNIRPPRDQPNQHVALAILVRIYSFNFCFLLYRKIRWIKHREKVRKLPNQWFDWWYSVWLGLMWFKQIFPNQNNWFASHTFLTSLAENSIHSPNPTIWLTTGISKQPNVGHVAFLTVFSVRRLTLKNLADNGN